MSITTEAKQKVFKKFGNSEQDTGSAEAQIALFTQRIEHLTNHLKTNKKDHSSRVGLLRLVGKRKRLLNYLYNNNIDRYRKIIADLKIRK